MIMVKFDENGKVENVRCNYCHHKYCCVSTNDTIPLRKHLLKCKQEASI